MKTRHTVNIEGIAAWIGVMTIALVLAACSGSDGGEQIDGLEEPSAAAEFAGNGGAPPEVSEFAEDWPLPNRDQVASRAVLDGPIDSTSVTGLEVVWRYDAPGTSTFGNLATTPLILGDDIFIEDLTGIVHAIDRETGVGRWTAGTSGSLFGPTGAAVGWGKVFATLVGPRGRGQLIAAYDIATGEELWTTDITINGGEINVQPFVHNGLVIASTSGFPDGVKGTISALDHETGSVVWSFATIESDDLWGNQINSGGGAWYPPALDVETETLFFGVGNPYPQPGAPGFPNGSSRPGDNRWTSGTVALDLATGVLRWGFQAFPHDLFDRDHILSILAETGIGDEDRTVLVTAGKGGVVIGLDPETGDVLWSTSVGVHQNDDVTEFDGPLEVLPGAQGGMVTPAAVADGVFYAAVINAAIVHKSPEEDSNGFGTQLGSRPSNIVAIDVSRGSILWDIEVRGVVLGGITVVNDLLFTATLSGEILALDRATGDTVWSYQADGGINGWPAVADDLIVFPVGLAAPDHLLALRLPSDDS